MTGLCRFRHPRRFAALAFLGLVTVMTVPVAQAQSRSTRQTRPTRQSGHTSRIDSTFAFDKSGSVTVNVTSGDVVVTGWSRDQVHVRASSEGDDIRLEASSSRMRLETNRGRGDETRFEVSVPYGVRVYATTRSGDVQVRGTRGQVEIHSQNGDVTVDDVTGRLDVNTFSGDLTASNISGDAEITTLNGAVKIVDVRGNVDVTSVSGDIELRGVTARLVRAKSTSGDVAYDGLIDPAGRYEFNTHSGDVTLHVPRDVSAQLTVSTWNGAVNSDFPITLQPGVHGIGFATSKRLSFQLGGGAARITAETFSGDITISSNGRGASERR